MYEIFLTILELVNYFGYLGIFFMTMIESTFIPIPSEITLIPAGYLVFEQKMSWFPLFISSVAGTVSGSLINYYIARKFGRQLLIKYGKIFFLNEEKLSKIEAFFESHGSISTFSGRLLPGIKHFIAFPAGLGKMPLKPFLVYTALGGSILNAILIGIGYFIGSNSDLIKQYLKQINFAMVVIVVCLVVFYIWKKRVKSNLR
jgi:membrane protein DedA with SNARE-associated domain